jgi:hypothetical protein
MLKKRVWQQAKRTIKQTRRDVLGSHVSNLAEIARPGHSRLSCDAITQPLRIYLGPGDRRRERRGVATCNCNSTRVGHRPNSWRYAFEMRSMICLSLSIQIRQC